jgi:lipid-binding SYLF domain-containing protein
MRSGSVKVIVIIVSLFLLTGLFGGKKDPEKERQEILKMRKETLATLYREVPVAEQEINSAIGYAVFSNVGINILLLSTANGAGVAHNKSTNSDIFMKMFSAGGGIGLGIKDFRGVFIFSDQEAFDIFVNQGWQASAQADAAAKSGEEGDAMSLAIDVAPGIRLYQMTENGLALQATIQGTKYWQDDVLNGKEPVVEDASPGG